MLSGLAPLPAGATLAAEAPLATDASGRGEPVAVARHQALGSSVSMLGSLTVSSGAFDAGFAVQGGAAGILFCEF